MFLRRDGRRLIHRSRSKGPRNEWIATRDHEDWLSKIPDLVTEVPKRRFAVAPFLVGVFLLLCALTFYYFAVLRVDYSKTALLDLRPYPDGVEYFGQAKAMLKGEGPSIQIGYDKLPSRYPLGYPALMLPWLKILPKADSVLAPFRTNQTLGLLMLLAVFGFYFYLAMPVMGGCATLLLATLPGFFTFCRSSMSDMSDSALVVLAFMFAYLGLNEERRWKIYLSAVFLGLSVNVRVQSLFFVPLLLAMLLFPVRGMRLRWFLHCAALPVVFALAASPVLVLNTIQFRSPLKTGYDFWIPYFSEHHQLFSVHYMANNATMLLRELTLRPKLYGANIASFFGTGTYFVPAFILLTFLGLSFIRFDRFALCASITGLTSVTIILSHNYHLVDLRYYLPLLIVLVAVAVLPVTWAAKNLFSKKQGIAAVLIFVLFAAACFGYPSRSGSNKVATDRSQAWDALHFTNPPRRSTQLVAQRRFLEMFGRQPGIVLSDIDPVYLNALLPEQFVAAPIDGQHHFRFSETWHYGRPEAVALVKRGLDQSIPIYALFVSQENMKKNVSRLPALVGYDWLEQEAGTQPAVLRFVRIGFQDGGTNTGND